MPGTRRSAAPCQVTKHTARVVARSPKGEADMEADDDAAHSAEADAEADAKRTLQVVFPGSGRVS